MFRIKRLNKVDGLWSATAMPPMQIPVGLVEVALKTTVLQVRPLRGRWLLYAFLPTAKAAGYAATTLTGLAPSANNRTLYLINRTFIFNVSSI